MGLSGLSFYDAYKGSNNVLGIDKTSEIGGYTRTIKISDFKFDYTGHFLHLKEFDCPASIGSYGNLYENEWNNVQKRSSVYLDKKFCEAPYQYNFGQLGKEHTQKAIQSYKFRKKINKPQNLEEFFNSYFGEYMCKKFFIPYNSKLYGVSPNKLSHKQLSRFFPHPDADIILNQSKPEDLEKKKTYNSNFWYPINGGIDLLIKHFKHPKELIYSKPIKIDINQKLITLSNKKEINFDNIVSSIPFDQLVKITGIKDKISLDLSSSKQFVVHIGTKQIIPELSDISWLYIPDIKTEVYRIGNYSFASNLMSGIDKGMSLYIELSSSSRNPIDQAISYLKDEFSLDERLIEVISLSNLDPGYVHFKNDQIEQIQSILNLLEKYSIYSIGRYGRWDYVSMEDCIISGKELAEKLN